MHDMYKKKVNCYMHFFILFQFAFCAPNKGHFKFTYIFTARSINKLKENLKKSIAVFHSFTISCVRGVAHLLNNWRGVTAS